MRIAVIGAGGAGLAAVKCCSEASKPITVVCYEKTDQVGGTWVYVPMTGKDKFGLPIHSSMYDNLRTNIPKEVMGYPDYPIPNNPKSYIRRDEMLAFLNDYCDHFKLRDKIKFLHNVELVEPTSKEEMTKGKWKLRVRDLEKSTSFEDFFDAVMVCNGHYFEPSFPSFQGHEIFKGQQMHSHDYRRPDAFANKSVVIIGAGPSGQDLALDISKKAKRVILSHHLKEAILTKFPDNVVQKTDIGEIKEHSVLFKDGTEENVDTIFYCTGYKFSFPFLNANCKVEVDSNMVTPLWKHIISIENPTLVFIGLPFYVCAFSMFDLQVRFVLRYLLNEKQLPSRESMLMDESKEKNTRFKTRGFSKKQFHMMGPLQKDYYNDLSDTVGIDRLPPYFTNVHNDSSSRFLEDLVNFREDRYKIIDNEHFVRYNNK